VNGSGKNNHHRQTCGATQHAMVTAWLLGRWRITFRCRPRIEAIAYLGRAPRLVRSFSVNKAAMAPAALLTMRSRLAPDLGANVILMDNRPDAFKTGSELMAETRKNHSLIKKSRSPARRMPWLPRPRCDGRPERGSTRSRIFRPCPLVSQALVMTKGSMAPHGEGNPRPAIRGSQFWSFQFITLGVGEGAGGP